MTKQLNNLILVDVLALGATGAVIGGLRASSQDRIQLPTPSSPAVAEAPGPAVVDLNGDRVGYLIEKPRDFNTDPDPEGSVVVDIDGNVVGHMNPQFVPLGETSSAPPGTTADPSAQR